MAITVLDASVKTVNKANQNPCSLEANILEEVSNNGKKIFLSRVCGILGNDHCYGENESRGGG